MSKRVKSNSVRLIAGRWRGTRLPVVDHLGLRPTTDRVRETLFNWLMPDIPSAIVLDLFAGTGALGLECLSRGARFVQFVEREKTVVKVLNQNLERLTVDTEQAAVYTADALSFLGNPADRQFDLVFLDPPFQSDLLAPAIEQLERGGWLSPLAVIYLEYDSKQQGPDTPATIPSSWLQIKNGRAGQSGYALYRRTA